MIFAVVIVLLAALVVAVIVAVAKDPGPAPIEIALGYEHALDTRDFDVLYRMSGPELRDGLTKADWVAARSAVHRSGAPGRERVDEVAADAERTEGDASVVTTRLTLHDGRVVHNEVRMLRRSRAWTVVAYEPFGSGAG